MEHFNLDGILGGKVKNRIDRVGVELEGGWEKLPVFEMGEKFTGDGSVCIDPVYETPEPAPTPSSDRVFNLVDEINRYNNTQAPHRQLFLRRPYSTYSNDDEVEFVDIRSRMISSAGSRAFIQTLRDRFAGVDANYYNSGPKQKKIHAGEIPSPVLELKKLGDWMRKNYPHHVNKTCGMHVHMSFRKALHYSRLMVPEYQVTMVNYLSKWAMENGIEKTNPIWDRLAGKNTYCKLEFCADIQAGKINKHYDHGSMGNRYTAINYCHGQHGTIECRILPMFKDVETSLKAINQVIDITNACLKVNVKKEEVLTAALIEDSVNSVISQNHRDVV
jgi:hypothetical protein